MNIKKELINTKKNLFARFFVLIIIFSIVLPTTLPIEQNDTVFAAKKKSKSTKKKSKRKSSNSTTKGISKSEHTFLLDTILESGIYYKHIIINLNNQKNDVHILQVDLNNKKTNIEVIKAGNNIVDLEKLPDMVNNVDSSNSNIIVGAINANFWRAYTNYPIGPTIVNGEVVEMPTHKKWSSTFFNDVGKPFMENFVLQGEVILKNNNRFNLMSVNRRSDTNGIVLYNRFGGDTIPYIDAAKVEELLLKGLDNVLLDVPFDDSTEQAISLDTYRAELFNAQKASMIEYGLKKVTLKYLDVPYVNAFVNCEVVSIDTGSVEIKPGHCILSFGKDIDVNKILGIGDKLNVHFWTNVNESELFLNSVSGTPRLVRDGIAQHEAYREGSKSKRFISGALPRTAIGFDKLKTKMFLVVVDARKLNGTCGVGLSQLADLMEYIGCYSAQNLDGGGSTTMVINGKNILNSNNPYTSRKLSVALTAVSLKKEKAPLSTKKRKRK